MAYIDFSVGNGASQVVSSLLTGGNIKILLSKKPFLIDEAAQGGDFIPYLEIKDYRLYQTNDISTELKELFTNNTQTEFRTNNIFSNNTQLIWGIPANISTSMLIVGSQTGTNRFDVNFTVDLNLHDVSTERAYWLKQLIISVSGR